MKYLKTATSEKTPYKHLKWNNKSKWRSITTNRVYSHTWITQLGHIHSKISVLNFYNRCLLNVYHVIVTYSCVYLNEFFNL